MFHDDPLPRNRKRNHLALGGVVLLLLAAMVLFALGMGIYWLWPRAKQADVPIVQIANSPPDMEENEAIRIFKDAKDSVVNVDTVVLRRGADFRIQEEQTETGSGFVWDASGHVVTNYHVIKAAYLKPNQLSLRVVMADRSSRKASVVAVAPDYDLAVIRILDSGDNFKPLKLGQSNGLLVGQKAYAIGNPFGLSLSMTKGIISALDREIDSPSGRPIPGAIQIDAPINPGNSGGPLLNKDGLLIGVNTSIATPSGGNVGIGFAIPVDTVVTVVKELIKSGRLLKPDLGVRLVDQRRLRQAGYPSGVMIASIQPDSPAAKAGLRALTTNQQTGAVRPGDLILQWNGKEVRGNGELEQFLLQSQPGNKVRLQIERDDRKMEVDVTLRGV